MENRFDYVVQRCLQPCTAGTAHFYHKRRNQAPDIALSNYVTT